MNAKTRKYKQEGTQQPYQNAIDLPNHITATWLNVVTNDRFCIGP